MQRLAAVALGTVFILVVFEVGLQVVAAVVASRASDAPASWLTGNTRILCLGDSNTYGLYLERSEAYPPQLEARWNSSGRKPSIEVLNAGIPGTNSSMLLRSFPEMLDAFRPDLVIVMVGANDFWTTPVEFQQAARTRGWLVRFLDRRSRLYKLFYMFRRAIDSSELEVAIDPDRIKEVESKDVIRYGDREFRMGFERQVPGPEGAGEALTRNLGIIARQSADFGAGLAFMSYATERKLFRVANALIQEAAAATGTPVIPLRPVLAEVCPEDACPEFFFPDLHPRANGYGLIARAIAERLPELIRAAR